MLSIDRRGKIEQNLLVLDENRSMNLSRKCGDSLRLRTIRPLISTIVDAIELRSDGD